jgi:ABC-type uncharacterized transport system permease subunit
MDTRVKQQLKTELSSRFKFIAGVATLVAILTGINVGLMNAGYFTFDGVATSSLSAAFMVACLEFLALGVIYMFFESAYADAKRKVRDAEYAEERAKLYESTAN